VLAFSALMKYLAFGSTSSSPLFEIAPQLEWIVIQLELLLAVWLVTGWLTRMAWAVSLFFFSSFAGATLLMVVQGRSSCGCLGAVEFNPLWMLLFDVGLMSVLIACCRTSFSSLDGREAASESAAYKSMWRTRGGLIVGMVIMVAGFTTSQVLMGNSSGLSSWVAEALPARLSGQYVLADPAVVDGGTGPVGGWQLIEIPIRNRSEQAVMLLGAEKTCRCQAGDNLPVAIPPLGKAVVQVKVRLGREPGVQESRFWLRTSYRQQPLVLCRWRARVVAEGTGDDRVAYAAPVANSGSESESVGSRESFVESPDEAEVDEVDSSESDREAGVGWQSPCTTDFDSAGLSSRQWLSTEDISRRFVGLGDRISGLLGGRFGLTRHGSDVRPFLRGLAFANAIFDCF